MITESIPLVVDPPDFDVSPDFPSQESTLPADDPTNFSSFGGTAGFGATTTVYAVPSARLFQINSCVLSIGYGASQTIIGQPVTIKSGSTVIAAAYLTSGVAFDVCQGGNITALAGQTLKITVGSDSTAAVSFHITGYLTPTATQQSAPLQQQTSSPPIG